MKKFIAVVLALIVSLALSFAPGANVKAESMTPEEMVQADLNLVTVPESAIISFPVAVNSPYNNVFHWSSDSPAVLEFVDGWFVVKRQADQDVTVTVTVEVVRPDDATVKGSKEFQVLIPKGVTQTKTFNITYHNVEAWQIEGFRTTYTLGEASFDIGVPMEAAGDVFLGWYTDEELTNKVEKIKIGSYGDIDLYAKWGVSVTYKVRHLGEPLEGTEYVLLKEETLNSFEGQAVSAEADEFAGFTFDPSHAGNILEGVVAADGSLILKLHYSRNSYTVTFDTQGGTAIDPVTEKYGAQIQAPAAPEKLGYEFAGWDVEFPLTVTKDLTVTASWNPVPVNYTVEYYVQKLDETGFELHHAEIAQALTGTNLTLDAPRTLKGSLASKAMSWKFQPRSSRRTEVRSSNSTLEEKPTQ